MDEFERHVALDLLDRMDARVAELAEQVGRRSTPWPYQKYFVESMPSAVTFRFARFRRPESEHG